ncbi:MAG: Cof-type HAD-IIB family hydrolase [Dehalococcoidia bacterium]|nr:Cof-type HAD-IIB family hydrolase [Dehalococcoidia bacterium]
MRPDDGHRLPYRLVALDLDDTLLGRDLVFSSKAKRAIQRVKEIGVLVTLATGRMFQSALPFAQELEITLPLICYQGALVRDPISREVLFHRPVPLEQARQVIEMARHWGLHVNAYVDDELYVERITPEAERYVRIARVPLHPVGDLLAFLKSPPTKVVIVSEEATIDHVMGELRAVFGSSLYITKSLPMFCEIAHSECNKGTALAFLASYLHIPQEETVALGDGLNDLEMIQWAGLGIAMTHAPLEVQAAAEWVTGSLQEDGAAQALERIFLAVQAAK